MPQTSRTRSSDDEKNLVHDAYQRGDRISMIAKTFNLKPLVNDLMDSQL